MARGVCKPQAHRRLLGRRQAGKRDLRALRRQSAFHFFTADTAVNRD